MFIILHNLIGYGCHQIMHEIGKFNQKTSIIPNGREKHVCFKLGKNLIFIDSMQFMNLSLENLVKSLSNDKFKYFSQEFHIRNN